MIPYWVSTTCNATPFLWVTEKKYTEREYLTFRRVFHKTRKVAISWYIGLWELVFPFILKFFLITHAYPYDFKSIITLKIKIKIKALLPLLYLLLLLFVYEVLLLRASMLFVFFTELNWIREELETDVSILWCGQNPLSLKAPVGRTGEGTPPE